MGHGSFSRNGTPAHRSAFAQIIHTSLCPTIAAFFFWEIPIRKAVGARGPVITRAWSRRSFAISYWTRRS